jgi:fatty acid synthase, animal type
LNVPRDSIIIEISPHHLLQPIIKRNLGVNISYLPLMKKNNNDENISLLLSSIGKLYTLGYNPSIEKLYPHVIYPVPRGTASISPLIKWDHSNKWAVPLYPDYFNPTGASNSVFKVDLQDAEDSYLSGHCIDGRILFPATGYLMLAWRQLARNLDVSYRDLPVEFENVKLHRATILPKTGVTIFNVHILETSGSFVITESGSIAVTGKIHVPDEPVQKFGHILKEGMKKEFFDSDKLILRSKDIYKELRLRGYDYGPSFQGITQACYDNKKGKAKIRWNGDWISFMDCMIQIAIVGKNIRGLLLPVRIDSLRCDPRILLAEVSSKEPESELEAVFDYHLNVGIARGIEFRGIKANLAPRRFNTQIPYIEKYQFVQYNEMNDLEIEDYDHLTEYTNVCNLMACKIASKFKVKQTSENQHEVNEEIIEKFLISKDENTALLKLLTNIHNMDSISNVENEVNNISSYGEDILLDTFTKAAFIRSQVDTVIENLQQNKINILEVNPSPFIISKFITHLIDTSAINMQVNYSLLHPTPNQLSLELDGNMQIYDWIIAKSKLPPDIRNMDLIIYRDTSAVLMSSKYELNLAQLFESLFIAVKEGGFVIILCRDRLTSAEEVIGEITNKKLFKNHKEEIIQDASKAGFTLIGMKSDSISACSILLRKVSTDIQICKQTFIEIKHDNYLWVEKLKSELKIVQTKPNGENLWLIANDIPLNGITGLVNCLRKEPDGHKIRCIFNYNNFKHENGQFGIEDPLLVSIVKKDLVMNIYNNGQFGSFRHFLFSTSSKLVPTEHAYLNVMTRGDLCSLKWFEAQHKYWPMSKSENQTLCHIYYAPLNFRDIMLATGKLPPDALPGDIALQVFNNINFYFIYNYLNPFP